MMTVFKVGDKVTFVRIGNEDCLSGATVGGKAVVTGEFDGVHYHVTYDEGDSRGWALPSSIELVPPTPKYTTEKRKANVGERILITEKYDYSMSDMTIGNTYEVVEDGVYGDYVEVIDDEGDQASAQDGYYEVIVDTPKPPPKPTKSARITALESQVAALSARVTAMEVSKLVKPKPTLSDLLATYPTPNEQRKAVIERAKAFVAKGQPLAGRKVDYVVNAEKRTVVALIYRISFSGEVSGIYARSIAKCDPSDVFNADIGKAIALGRALGLDVTEFTKAVQPTEVVVGMVVYDNDATNGSDGNVRVKEVMPPGYVASDKGYTFEDGWAFLEYAVIVDDTEAQY